MNLASIYVLEILSDNVGVISRRMLAENVEEIIGGGNLPILLREIILKETEEGRVADARAQSIQEMRTS